MKNLLILCLLLPASCVFAQQKTILLKDGSCIYGEIVRVDSLTHQTTVRLSDLTEITFSSANIADASQKSLTYTTFNKGHKLLKRGKYFNLAFHTLSAKTNNDFQFNKRWNLGAHFSKGYQFNQFLALGAGAGIDLHDEFFMPVFVEMRGALTNASGFSLDKREGTGYRLPLAYNIQFGYNFPLTEIVQKLPLGDILGNEDFMVTGGGLLFYPSIGFVFPTRSGVSLKIDVGYKIQKYKRDFTDWSGYEVNETHTLKSFAIRGGVIF